jgi:hypothetical protein
MGISSHVAATWDGTETMLYVNGVLDGTNSVGWTGAANTQPVKIGQRGGSNPYFKDFFHGLIDEVRIYDRALSDEEILAIFNAGGAGKCTMTIDITPGDNPNSINCNNDMGVIPVAILTTDRFDATMVDHSTASFEGASETHVNKKSSEPRRHEEDVDGDGDTDLVFHFRLADASTLLCESTEGTLTVVTFDGTPVQATGSLNMVKGTTVITVGRPIR